MRDERRSATVAAVREDTGEAVAERLTFHASSTTTVLAAIQLSLRLLIGEQPDHMILLTDSRAALEILQNQDRAPQLARAIAARIATLQH